MDQKKDRFDIVNEVLEACIMAYPVSSFVISLYKQYQKRGSLSKKQLQGLYAKASEITDYSLAKLATLEALIKKMPTRYKSEIPEFKEAVDENAAFHEMIATILHMYPEHKRVLFLQSRIQQNHTLSSTDIADLKRFADMVNKKASSKG